MTRARVAGLLIALVATALVACDRPLPPVITAEDVVADLERRPPDAMDPGVRHDTLTPGDPLRGEGGRPALVMPPGAAARWRVAVPADGLLRFAVGVQGDGRRDESRRPIRFTASIDGATAFTRDVNPAATRRDRRWIDAEVDLARWSGREVVVALATATDAGGPPAGVPGWSRVHVVARTSVPRQRTAPDRPNLLVLVVDTLRADAVGPRRDGTSATPALDGLAARGLRFTQAVSQSSWTLPSVASLMTGLPPRTHGALGQDEGAAAHEQAPARWGVLGDAALTWPELALRAGVTTVGVSANPLVSRGTNVAQGFETFVELPWDPEGRNWPHAEEVNDAFLAWLRGNREQRFVAYLHYMEPHDPYTPSAAAAAPAGVRPAIAKGWVQDAAQKLNWEHGPPLSPDEIAHLRRLYQGEVADWDRALGHLLAALEASGVADRTVVIVTADHGEEFQEHGRLKHGSHLYEETIHVPLVVAGPGVPVGRRDDLVQGIDLFPTVAAILALRAPANLAGHPLLAEPRERPAIVETATGIGPDGGAVELTAVRTSGWKLIDAPALSSTELYDLRSDPDERHDRAELADERAALAETLARWRAATPIASQADTADLGEKLRALGYVR